MKEERIREEREDERSREGYEIGREVSEIPKCPSRAAISACMAIVVFCKSSIPLHIITLDMRVMGEVEKRINILQSVIPRRTGSKGKGTNCRRNEVEDVWQYIFAQCKR